MKPKTRSTVNPPLFAMEVLRDKATLIFCENAEEVNEPDREDGTPGFHGWQYDRYTLERRYDPDLRSRVEARLGEWIALAKKEERDAERRRVDKRRKELLAETDWTAVRDSPITGETRAKYERYRQALRDVDDKHPDKHPDYPFGIVWPELED